jgi:adenylate cyclase
VNDAPLLDLFRADVAACGARIEENLVALSGDPSPSPRLAAIARDARTIGGGARLLGLEPAARLALAIEDAAGAGARGAIPLGSTAFEALLAATSLIARIAAASAHLAGWMVQHAASVDAAVSAITTSIEVPPVLTEPKARAPREKAPAQERKSRRARGGDEPPPSAPAMIGAHRGRRGMSVLLVDDQPMIAEAIRQMLAGETGIRLHHCVDPTEALAMAAEVKPTVILQDLVMPDIDGLTLIRYFRAYPATSDVPIIALSTREEPAVKAEAFQLGANDYVVKLPDRLELVARIRYLSKGYIHLLDSQEAWAAVLASQEQLEIRNRFIRQTFGRYLSDEIVESLLEKPGGLDLGGETRRVTIMMTDLRGFTPLCETLEPRQVVAILNNYLAAMTDIVVRHGGTIDEFIGDAILAVFGAPIRHDDDARRAIACAVEMQQTMDQVNAQNTQLGLPRVEMGIGINTGEVVVGNIGSDRRAKYGVVGRHVNLASRIESCTIGGQILAAESTIRDAGEGIHIHAQMEIVPKGVTAPMTIYDVGGIGAPYNRYLAMRSDEPLVPLTSPIAVRFLVLKGKSAGGEGQSGEIVSLSSRVGRVRADCPVAPMENVKIEIWDEDLWGTELWGKTIAAHAIGGPGVKEASFDVWFTSIPDDVREVLSARRTSSAPPRRGGPDNG